MEELEKDADSLGELLKKQNNKNIPPFELHEKDPADQKKCLTTAWQGVSASCLIIFRKATTDQLFRISR